MLVSDELIAEVERIGLASKPNEACGLAFYDGSVVELANASNEPHHRWRFGPFEGVKAVLEARGFHEWMQCPESFDYLVWHTHPSGTEGPSVVDLRLRLPGVDYLVVALTDDGPIATRY